MMSYSISVASFNVGDRFFSIIDRSGRSSLSREIGQRLDDPGDGARFL